MAGGQPVYHWREDHQVATYLIAVAFGDYSKGRYAWIFENIRRLAEPYPIKGRQRLWRVSPDDAMEIRARLVMR